MKSRRLDAPADESAQMLEAAAELTSRWMGTRDPAAEAAATCAA